MKGPFAFPVDALAAVFAFAALPLAGQTLATALHLAETGHCQEALPLLKKLNGHLVDPKQKRQLGNDGVRCAMGLDRWDDAVDFLRQLNHDFPADPEILYLETHTYSDLSNRSAQKLLYTSPASPEVHELNAESLELQGKWDEAAAEYRRVLEIDPKLPGIHYRLGRIILSKEKSNSTPEDARKEMEAEIAIDPNNPGAEYVLGELARQAEQLPVAIEHFRKATEEDAGFADAFIGLGQADLGTDHYPEAVLAFENAVKLQPDNPTAHYFLAIAYTRVGRKADAARQKQLQEQALARAQHQKDEVKLGVSGQQNPQQQ